MDDLFAGGGWHNSKALPAAMMTDGSRAGNLLDLQL
jgi:hypothetical protein